MALFAIAIAVLVIFALGYRVYGQYLKGVFELKKEVLTPSQKINDGMDFIPTPVGYLLGQHFSAIAAAGPIVGPILAGMLFGWLPALLWIVIGAIFIGGVHDMGALVASIRHQARSIAEVVRKYVNPRAYILFLFFIWFSLVYVITAFTDITASAFTASDLLDNGVVLGPAVASSSLQYLMIGIAMGLALRYLRMSVKAATLIFLPLVFVAIWAGPHLPLDVARLFPAFAAARFWDGFLLLYCFAAALLPVWALLQPRGHLGGYFLYITLAAGLLGIFFGGFKVQYPAFLGFINKNGDPLFPFLIITIACGACSGFHAIVSTGTTSKQLKYETDARPVGYGSMILEGVVAFVALSTVMMTAPGTIAGSPETIYARGIAGYLSKVFSFIPFPFAFSFGLLAFATFVYDTLDVCTRLGRYVLQELTGWKTGAGRVFSTLATLALPAWFLSIRMIDPAGNPVPGWKIFWPLFGSSNQLLAALTLLGITVWLAHRRRAWWVAAIPMAFMLAMTLLSLAQMFLKGEVLINTVICAVLIVLAVWLVAEAGIAMARVLVKEK